MLTFNPRVDVVILFFRGHMNASRWVTYATIEAAGGVWRCDWREVLKTRLLCSAAGQSRLLCPSLSKKLFRIFWNSSFKMTVTQDRPMTYAKMRGLVSFFSGKLRIYFRLTNFIKPKYYWWIYTQKCTCNFCVHPQMYIYISVYFVTRIREIQI